LPRINVLSAVAIIGIFTVLDWILHYFGVMPELDVLPKAYFLNKIIIGTLGLFLLYIFTNTNDYVKSAIVAVLLQVRYFYTQSYDNAMMIGLHAVLLFAAIRLHKYLAQHHQNIYPMVIG